MDACGISQTSPDQRGITLVEVTVVMVLASLVMVGLVGFYVASQQQWLTASSQVVTQREGTLALEQIADSIRTSASAVVTDSPDSLHQRLTLYDAGGVASMAFFWNAADSLLHWEYPPGTARGPVVASRVNQFRAFENDTLVTITALEMIDPDGDLIPLSGGAMMYNHP
jgi:hypothetical protein